ncbi:unnamed protein product [Acanthoscelides obtectus]|uniref:Uncharacterized protein n=1 Tax=Acanthoscelides obtectus TaxID=200917 RepID=A0A9P0KYV3_ACAOB|nr:unnamed protein product [Acanthoscelides obtectus]CAK1674936.1 hypothetical protein AOBTE_LOCUS29822 [Acanthoscelides obtectus]
MAGALLVVIVAMVPLLPEAATKPLFFFYGDSDEDLLTDYIEYTDDSVEYGDKDEELPAGPGGGAIINNGVVVTINGIPFNCTRNVCEPSVNGATNGGQANASVTSASQEVTLPSVSEGKKPEPEAVTAKATPGEGNEKVSTGGVTTGKPAEGVTTEKPPEVTTSSSS